MKQYFDWTVFGPFDAPPSGQMWAQMRLDGVKTIPPGGVEVDAPDGSLDFRELFGAMPVQTVAFAAAAVEFPTGGALTLRWNVDYWAALWLDGQEIFSLRSGAMGGPHRFSLLVEPGRHVFSMRVMSGSGGWSSSLVLESMDSEIPDDMRSDRGARWRDYRRSAVRLEYRPAPDDRFEGVGMEKFEEWAAAAGVDARWIGLVDHIEGAMFQSKHLPPSKKAKPEYEAQFKEWIKVLRARRFSALTWLPLTLWGPAWEAHPDWRVKFLVDPPPDGESRGHNCCLNSPYGDALLRFSVECLQRFDLDGIWFDGAGLHGGAVRQVVGCVCEHCAKRFLAETGRIIPSKYDWSSEDFRHWVKWRYDNFAANWQRLVDGVHAAVPEAAIAFNHYHRENVGWNGAIPLNPFGHDFISATEADYEPSRAAFYTRCMRAYGRGHAETWMGLNAARTIDRHGLPSENPRKLIDFALGCCVGGGHPSVGGFTPLLKLMADEVKQRAPYLGLPSIPQVALHVSQQTETFVNGRDPAIVTPGWEDSYWPVVGRWHNLLSDAGRSCDVVYDDQLTFANLSRYPVLVMPLPTSLSDAQHAAITQYVENGGRLLVGPDFGQADEWGEPLEKPLPLPAGSIPLVENLQRLLPAPLVEPSEGLHLGLFRRGENETVVVLRNVDSDLERQAPRQRWGASLRWRGAEPFQARAMLPEPGPALPLRRDGGAWRIELPPMVWGQVVVVETK